MLPTQSRPTGIDSAIGQIDLVGSTGEVLRSWRIRTPKCTLGSGTECGVQLTGDGIAPHHLTLVFGKRFTLLRAIGPTRIANRLVREWLIDHPTEIQIGPCRLVIHPTIGVMATVVHAEGLIEQASRLCKEPTPVVPTTNGGNKSIQNVDSKLDVEPISPLVEEPQNEPAPPNAQQMGLANIEGLLTSLQESLATLQSTFGNQVKESEASVSKTVSDGIQSISKTWFTSLSEQFETQSEKQQSLVSRFADQVSDRLGAIDEHLTRFTETHTIHANYLAEILGQAKSEQQVIESRFEEIIRHRDELMQAVQVLRTEIASAYANSTIAADESSFRSDSNSSSSADSQNQHAHNDAYSAETSLVQPGPELEESLERAQHQIQNYNQQLRALESEKELAQQWVSTIADSLTSDPYAAASEDPVANEIQEESPADSSAMDAVGNASYSEYYTANYSENDLAVEPPQPSDEPPRDLLSSESVSSDSSYAAEDSTYTRGDDSGESQGYQLPSWFTQDEPVSSASAAYDPYVSHGGYSQELDEAPYDPINPINRVRSSELKGLDSHSEQALPVAESQDSDSISQRLQRMLQEADSRRGNSGASNAGHSSRRWSQSYGSKTNPNLLPSNATESNAVREEVGPSDPPPVQSNQDPYREVTDSSSYLEPSHGIEQYNSPYEPNDYPSSDHSDEVPSAHEPHSELYPHSQLSVEQKPEESESANNFNDQSDSNSEGSQEEEESIEEYMQRLLQRVRGGSESVTTTSSPNKANSPRSVTPTGNPKPSKSRVAASLGLDLSPSDSEPEKLVPLTNESFVPRQTAPEQRGELDALRELANSNARRALSRSDHRRTNSAFFFKLGVTALAVTSASALLLLNGLTLNAPFAGMIAAIVVAVLWGYDCVNHFKKIKVSTTQAATVVANEKHSNSIQVGSADGSEDRWRPSAT